MQSTVSFILDGRRVDIDFDSPSAPAPTTTVLNYIRSLPSHKGTKEGCAEGDCGACTVVIAGLGEDGSLSYKAVDSCLLFLPMIHGKELITVENLKSPGGALHPVQEEMVKMFGSQCGFCTPGIVMSIFALYKNSPGAEEEEIRRALAGNLCRCTGYRPIIDAASRACALPRADHFTENEASIIEQLRSISGESIRIQRDRQKYFRPASLGEALTLMHEHKDAIVVNGATDIALRVTKGHEFLSTVIDLSALDELKHIDSGGQALSVGSGVPINDIIPVIEKSFPSLYGILSVFGSHQIRNVATLGGNLGTASPISDIAPVLIAYRSIFVAESLNGKREIPAGNFITGYRKTLRKPDELITAVIIPKQAKASVVKSYKISKRKSVDISTVNAGFRIDFRGDIIGSAMLVYGGMADMTKRAAAAEQFLVGKRWERSVAEEAMRFIEKDFSPISDARGSSAFRMAAAKNLLMKFWLETSVPESGRAAVL